MSELLDVYDLTGKFLRTQERGEFYDEIKKEFRERESISRKIKTVRVFLMNSQGRIYLQKRSDLKKENPGLYDKTVGGHVISGNSFELTAVKECAEELGIPVVVLPENEFEEAVLNVDLRVIGLLRKIAYVPDFISERILVDGKTILQPVMTTIYVGYYDGAIRFADGESSGIEVFSLPKLEEEIKNYPTKFTKDVKFLVGEYRNFFTPIRNS